MQTTLVIEFLKDGNEIGKGWVELLLVADKDQVKGFGTVKGDPSKGPAVVVEIAW